MGKDVAWLLKALYVLGGSVPDGTRPTFEEFDAGRDKTGELVLLEIKVSSNETGSAEQIAQAITAGGLFSAEYKNLVTDDTGKTAYSIVMRPVGDGDAG